MELVKYDAMIHAITVCERVDEVKDIRDKVIALETYAKQAKNFDAERKCATVRVRAERQCGILLQNTEKAKGAAVSGWKENAVTKENRVDGSVTYPIKDTQFGRPKTLADMGITKKESSAFQKLADIDEDVFEERIQAVLAEDNNKPTSAKIIDPKIRGTQGTGENEWYTPQKYVESARKVMGEITLDPASSALANKVVGAEVYFDEERDGLKEQWHHLCTASEDGYQQSKVWMNPPYAQPFIEQFMVKLSDEYFDGSVSEAIALTHNYTDTKWFQYAQQRCSAMCFTRGRISFVNPEGVKAAPTQGQAFFYFGQNIEGFFREFSQYGFVVSRVSYL